MKRPLTDDELLNLTPEQEAELLDDTYELSADESLEDPENALEPGTQEIEVTDCE